MNEKNNISILSDAALVNEESGHFDSRFGITDEYSIGRCPLTGTLQTYPVPDEVELKSLYEKYYNFTGSNVGRYNKIREKILNSRIYQKWLKIDGDISFNLEKGLGRSLLDYGCNEGRNLTVFRNNGFHAEGFEINSIAANEARKRGFNVFENNDSISKTYDVIVLSNVLEHSTSPINTLTSLYPHLKDNGEIWISLPNSNSALRKIFGRKWINWHVPFHICHFSKESLESLLNSCGFSVVDVKNRTPALWVAHSTISFFFARKGVQTKTLRNPILVSTLMLATRLLLFPLLILINNSDKGDCLIVKGRKSSNANSNQ